MKENFKKAYLTTATVIQHYPFVILSALLATFFVLEQINYENALGEGQHELREIQKELNDRLISVFFLGISLFYFINLVVQRYRLSRLFSLLGIPLLILVFYYIEGSFSSFVTGLKYFVIFIISHLIVSYIGFIKDDNEEGFWEFNKKLFVNLVLTGIFTAVLAGGVMLAIAGMDNLFDLNFDSDVYQNTLMILLIMGSVLIFLHFCKEGIDEMRQAEPYPVILKFFVQYILIPLLIIYSVILYAYMGKIILQWELPRGWVTQLVTAYSVFGILALLLVHPLKEISERSWVRIFSDIFYYSLIPLVILMSVGIYTRIDAYGVTESRYYVVLLAVWIFFISLYFIFNKKANIRLIPISLSVVLLLSIMLPMINAFNISKKSQSQRFIRILKANNLLLEDDINFDAEIVTSQVNELESIFYYLKSRNNLDNIAPYFSETALEELENSNKYNRGFSDRFKNRISDESSYEDNLYFSISTQDHNSNESRTLYDIKDYDFMIPNISTYTNCKVVYEDTEINTLFKEMRTSETTHLWIMVENDENSKDSLDLYPIIKEYVEDHQNDRSSRTKYIPEIKLDFSVGDIDFTLLLDDLEYSRNNYNNELRESYNFNGVLLGNVNTRG